MESKPHIKVRICQALEAGATYEKAAHYAGLGVSTMYKWLADGREEDEGIYREFLDEVKKAESKFLLKHLSNIGLAAKHGDWKASAWLIERRHPEYRTNVIPEKNEFEVTIQIGTDTSELIAQLKPTEKLLELQGPIIDLDEE